MYVKPAYLRRRRVRRSAHDTPYTRHVEQVSSETPRPIGFNPTATVTNQIVIAR